MKKVHLGVDLGSHAIKVCKMDASGASCHVSQQPLMPDRSSKDEALSGAALVGRLQAVVNELYGRGKAKVHVAVEDPTVSTGYLELPKLNPEQQKVAIPSAVAREIPHPLQDVHLYTVPVPPLGDEKLQGVFFVAVPKKVYEARNQLFTQAGLEVASCEPGLLATIRGLTRNSAPPGQEALGVVCSGFRTTSVTMLRGCHPYYSRDFRMAGSDFTYAFQMGDQLSWSEAEKSKLEYNLAERDFKVESFLQRWLSDVQRSLHYAAQKHPQLVPTRMLLSGGTSLWTGLPERLSEFLNVPVARQEWSKVRPSSSAGTSEIVFYEQALGLVSGS